MSTEDDLTTQRCQPCEGGVEPLTPAQAQALLPRLSAQWQLAEDSRRLQGEWKFRNFFHAMSFANAVAHLANTEDHHPELSVGYGYCRVVYYTHAIDGLSVNDFICAAKIDALPR